MRRAGIDSRLRLPTRNERTGQLFTSSGRINIKKRLAETMARWIRPARATLPPHSRLTCVTVMAGEMTAAP